MTNSSQKPSLLGRQRTKDLQQALQPESGSLITDSISQVKKTLLDLQENIFSESPEPTATAVSAPIAAPLASPEPTPVVAPVSRSVATPISTPVATVEAVAPKVPTVELKKTTFSTDKVSRVTFEQEAFEYLLQFHQNLRNPHQAIRVTYSLSEQNRKLLEAMKKIINYYAESLKNSNLNQHEVTQKSQALLDTLVSRLSREGVKLRALSLTPERF